MHAELTHIISQQRVADLSRAAAERQVTDQPRSLDRRTRLRPIRRVGARLGRPSAARA